MTETLRNFIHTVEALESKYPSSHATLDKIILQLDRYSRSALTTTTLEKRGTALSVPIEATLKVAILMLESIDTGSSGLDDSLAKELRTTYEKYLGTFKV